MIARSPTMDFLRQFAPGVWVGSFSRSHFSSSSYRRAPGVCELSSACTKKKFNLILLHLSEDLMGEYYWLNTG